MLHMWLTFIARIARILTFNDKNNIVIDLHNKLSQQSVELNKFNIWVSGHEIFPSVYNWPERERERARINLACYFWQCQNREEAAC